MMLRSDVDWRFRRLILQRQIGQGAEMVIQKIDLKAIGQKRQKTGIGTPIERFSFILPRNNRNN